MRPVLSNNLLTFLRQQNPDLASNLDTSSPLSALGVDSFALIELILFIERTYQVKIPLDQLVPDRISSLDAIADMVREISKKSLSYE